MDKLIVPVNADDFSLQAVDLMFSRCCTPLPVIRQRQSCFMTVQLLSALQ